MDAMHHADSLDSDSDDDKVDGTVDFTPTPKRLHSTASLSESALEFLHFIRSHKCTVLRANQKSKWRSGLGAFDDDVKLIVHADTIPKYYMNFFVRHEQGFLIDGEGLSAVMGVPLTRCKQLWSTLADVEEEQPKFQTLSGCLADFDCVPPTDSVRTQQFQTTQNSTFHRSNNDVHTYSHNHNHNNMRSTKAYNSAQDNSRHNTPTIVTDESSNPSAAVQSNSHTTSAHPFTPAMHSNRSNSPSPMLSPRVSLFSTQRSNDAVNRSASNTDESHLLRVVLGGHHINNYGQYFSKLTVNKNGGAVGLISMHDLASVLNIPFNSCVEVVLHEKLCMAPCSSEDGDVGSPSTTTALDLGRMLIGAEDARKRPPSPAQHDRLPSFSSVSSTSSSHKRIPPPFLVRAVSPLPCSTGSSATVSPPAPMAPGAPHLHPVSAAQQARKPILKPQNSQSSPEVPLRDFVNVNPPKYSDRSNTAQHPQPLMPTHHVVEDAVDHNENASASSASTAPITTTTTPAANTRGGSPRRTLRAGVASATVNRAMSPSVARAQSAGRSGASPASTTTTAAAAAPAPFLLRSSRSITPSRGRVSMPHAQQQLPTQRRSTPPQSQTVSTTAAAAAPISSQPSRFRSQTRASMPTPGLSKGMLRTSLPPRNNINTTAAGALASRLNQKNIVVPKPLRSGRLESDTPNSDHVASSARLRVWTVLCESARLYGQTPGWTGADIVVSMRVNDGSQQFAVACSFDMDETLLAIDVDAALQNTDVVDINGRSILDGSCSNSRSDWWQIHSSVYRARSDVNSVVVAFSMFASVLACARTSMPMFHRSLNELTGSGSSQSPRAEMRQRAPQAQYDSPQQRRIFAANSRNWTSSSDRSQSHDEDLSTPEIRCGDPNSAQHEISIAHALGNNLVALVNGHGQLAVGLRGCEHAIRNAWKFERLCEMFYRCRLLGADSLLPQPAQQHHQQPPLFRDRSPNPRHMLGSRVMP